MAKKKMFVSYGHESEGGPSEARDTMGNVIPFATIE